MDTRWIPNAVTLSRAVLVLPFWLAFTADGRTAAGAAIGVALLIELTDLTDGWLARRLDAASDLGKLLDPAADAFSRQALFLALATRPTPDGGPPWLPGWVVALLLFRDVGVAFIRQVAAARGRVVGARASGKLKAWVQGIAIWGVLVLHFEATSQGSVLADRRTLAFVLGTVAALYTILTLVDYVWGNRDALRPVTATSGATSGHDAAGGQAP